MLNDRQRDQVLLKSCLEGDQDALIQWKVASYRTEVIRTIKAVVDHKVPGRHQELIKNLVVHCTWMIYENYAKVPSRFYSLKTQVQKFAFSYVNAYLREYLRAPVVRVVR
jgi:hypothetical protein